TFLQLRKVGYAIVNSPSIVLLIWHQTCVIKGLKSKLIPRDVSTQWNLTFNMLKVALQYREAINNIIGNK
ncbi:hypothetical protein DFH09DRAFT_813620, partial [Mycena vulgaris]